MRIRSLLAATAVATTLSAGAYVLPAQAEEPKPEEMFSEGASMIIDAIELMLLAIPTYEAPEVLPNGDIIIRRAKPGSGEKEQNKDLEAPGEEL